MTLRYIPTANENSHMRVLLERYSVYESNQRAIFLKPLNGDLPRIILKKDSLGGLDSVRIVGGSGKNLGKVLVSLYLDNFKQAEAEHGRR